MSETHRADYDAFELQVSVNDVGDIEVSFHTGGACRVSMSLDAHLWLWTTNAFVEEGYDVVRAWGFRPLTLLTWCKNRPGVGYYLRNNTEHCILASRGAPLVPADKAMASWYEWPRGEHSAKPEAFYDLVEQVSPSPYVELFSRRARFSWDTWGDEALNHVELAS